MALFVDGPACTVDDLVDQDSGLLDVSQTTGINVSTKLRLAMREIATDLQLWLNKSRSNAGTVWMWSPSQSSALPGMQQIVVTPELKRWETMHALALFYRDAYFALLADRYQAKWREFTSLARDVREAFLAGGLPLVGDPIPQALPPALGAIKAPQTGGTFYSSVAWVNAAGQEGAASPASSITLTDGNLMTVTPLNPPGNATGYHIYAGSVLDGLVRQNSVLLPTTVTYNYIPGQISQGPPPGSGQDPDFFRPLQRTWMRG